MTKVYTLKGIWVTWQLWFQYLVVRTSEAGLSLCNLLAYFVVSWLLSSVLPRETIWDRDRPSLLA